MKNYFFPSTIFQTLLYIVIGFFVITPFVLPFLVFENQISNMLPKDLPMFIIYVIGMSIFISIAFIINWKRSLNYKFVYELGHLNTLFLILLFLFSLQLGLNLPLQKTLHTCYNVNNPQSYYSLVYILGAIFFAPVYEEILFRGIIYKGLLATYSPKNSIIISSVVFGIFHGQPGVIPGAIFFGIIFGYVYYKTNSLGIIILLHSATNLFGILGSLVNKYNGSQNITVISDIYGRISAPLILVLLLMLLISSYYLLIKARKNDLFK